MSAKPTRGIDHVGLTVPNLDQAALFFEQAFGAVSLYGNIKTLRSSVLLKPTAPS